VTYRRITVSAAALVLAAGGSTLAAARNDASRPPLRLVTVSKKLRQPTYVTANASEPRRLYVVERRGIVRVLERGRLRVTPFVNLTALVSTAGERGLLSIAFHPEYASNRLLYAMYTDRAGAINVVELRSSGNAVVPASRRTLVRIEHDESLYHNGGQLQFGPDGLLYAGTGDGGYLGPQPDPHGNSQNLDVLLGKIFTLDVAQPSPRPRIVAYGLRNPWRFSFDRNGDALIGDVGWNGFEEVNRLPRGATLVNFGWSVYEARRARRSGGDPPPLNPAGELTWPILTYSTRINGNCSITGGYAYRGRAVPRLAGRYVFGDYCSGRIWSVPITGGTAGRLRLEPVRARGLTSFGEDARGELYAVTLSGALYRLAR
jgi:glucose/arabinose dehydrogenase